MPAGDNIAVFGEADGGIGPAQQHFIRVMILQRFARFQRIADIEQAETPRSRRD